MSHQGLGKRDPITVLRDELEACPGGIKEAAEEIGRSPGTLYNKFSDSMPQNEIGALEFIALARRVKRRANNTRPVEAFCSQFDGTFLPLPSGAAADDDLLQDYLDIVSRMGDLSQEFTAARGDGVISPAEFALLEERAHKTVQAIMHFLEDLRGNVRELPPAAPALVVAKGGK